MDFIIGINQEPVEVAKKGKYATQFQNQEESEIGEIHGNNDCESHIQMMPDAGNNMEEEPPDYFNRRSIDQF